ncbi:ent-kaurenoic acid oxidase 1-like [Triticum aestivum]|uniref:ent-kaurenoic acid oxidase 1-like n=2 Tax=Triticum aestivum TaxID=4565 RepID=UPI001D00FEA9|nr:ent-kaurenoic acid oxidase 1-like [Triticum aestivum]XP_044435783.1 ent-kaurenoic acid oxidase 1-like [Triticum aestivum]
MVAMEGAVGAWAWWLGLLFGAVPLLCLAVWHSTDAWYCAAFALKYRGHGSNGIRRRLPPGHMGVPFLGETLSLLWYFKLARRPDDFIGAKKSAYGSAAGMYRTHLFGSPSIIACSPAANKFVLQSPESFGIRWPVPELVGITSVVNVEGSSHARLRGFILAAINRPSSLQTIATVVQPRVVAALRTWADKGTIVAATEIKKVTFANICKMFISMEPSPLTDKIDRWFGDLLDGLRAYPFDFPGTASHGARKSRRKLDAIFREELEARKKVDRQCDDLMGGLMQMKDEQGKKLSNEEVVDNIVSLVIAGYESTTIAIMWAVYHLAKSPVVLAKLREENIAMSKSKGGSTSTSLMITHTDIPKMKYTAKVVEETIRMANIAPMVHRVANRDVEYRGYTIPKGWAVLVWLRSLHTDPNYYEDPLSFNPNRWDEPAKAGTYQVFGGGPRVCAGNMLARLQVTIILHHLCVGYEWELLNPDAEINYLPHPRPADGAAMAFRKLST